MSKREPRLRKSRRIGEDLQLTNGTRPVESKCKISTLPGVHGTKRKRTSEYGTSLLEKQRFSFAYGLKNEMLRKMHKEAMREMKAKRKQGKEVTYDLMVLIEKRLGNVVYRMGFASTRAEARQLVSHRAISVNNQIVDRPFFMVKENDVIEVRQKQKSQLRIAHALDLASKKPEISWLKVDKEAKQGTVLRLPTRDELPPEFQSDVIIQFYSK